MAVQKPQGSQVDIQNIASDLAADPTAIGDIAAGLASDPGAQATLDAEYVRNDADNQPNAPAAGQVLVLGSGSPQVWENRLLVEADISDLQVYAHLVGSPAVVPDDEVSQSSVTQHEAALSIAEGQITGLDKYTQAEVDTLLDVKADLTGSPGVVPDAQISESSVTQHQAALSITESQISDLQNYAVLVGSPEVIADANISESSVTQHQAALSITESQISDLGSYQPLDANLTTIAGLAPALGEVMVGTGSPVDWAARLLVKADISDFSDGDYAAASHTHAMDEITEAATPVTREVMIGSTASPSVWEQRLLVEADISDLGTYEPAFTKNTAFNKNFGSAAGTVCEGNDVRLSDARDVDWVAVPATASSTGTAGQMAYGGDGGSPETFYLYVCVATDTWVRTALASW